MGLSSVECQMVIGDLRGWRSAQAPDFITAPKSPGSGVSESSPSERSSSSSSYSKFASQAWLSGQVLLAPRTVAEHQPLEFGDLDYAGAKQRYEAEVALRQLRSRVAVHIQAMFRGHRARKIVAVLVREEKRKRERLEERARICRRLQDIERGRRLREGALQMAAAIRIQCWYRRYIAIVEVCARRQERSRRLYLQRKRCEHEHARTTRSTAVVRLQAAWRAFVARQVMERLLLERCRRQSQIEVAAKREAALRSEAEARAAVWRNAHAALQIQRLWRGVVARRSVAVQRLAALEHRRRSPRSSNAKCCGGLETAAADVLAEGLASLRAEVRDLRRELVDITLRNSGTVGRFEPVSFGAEAELDCAIEKCSRRSSRRGSGADDSTGGQGDGAISIGGVEDVSKSLAKHRRWKDRRSEKEVKREESERRLQGFLEKIELAEFRALDTAERLAKQAAHDEAQFCARREDAEVRFRTIEGEIRGRHAEVAEDARLAMEKGIKDEVEREARIEAVRRARGAELETDCEARLAVERRVKEEAERYARIETDRKSREEVERLVRSETDKRLADMAKRRVREEFEHRRGSRQDSSVSPSRSESPYDVDSTLRHRRAPCRGSSASVSSLHSLGVHSASASVASSLRGSRASSQRKLVGNDAHLGRSWCRADMAADAFVKRRQPACGSQVGLGKHLDAEALMCEIPECCDITAPVAGRCDGLYELVPEVSFNGLPIWKHRGAPLWLFSGPGDCWTIGEESEMHVDCCNIRDGAQSELERRRGFISSAAPHHWRMPDEMPRGGWLWHWVDRGQWLGDPEIVVRSVPISHQQISEHRSRTPPSRKASSTFGAAGGPPSGSSRASVVSSGSGKALMVDIGLSPRFLQLHEQHRQSSRSSVATVPGSSERPRNGAGNAPPSGVVAGPDKQRRPTMGAGSAGGCPAGSLSSGPSGGISAGRMSGSVPGMGNRVIEDSGGSLPSHFGPEPGIGVVAGGLGSGFGGGVGSGRGSAGGGASVSSIPSVPPLSLSNVPNGSSPGRGVALSTSFSGVVGGHGVPSSAGGRLPTGPMAPSSSVRDSVAATAPAPTGGVHASEDFRSQLRNLGATLRAEAVARARQSLA